MMLPENVLTLLQQLEDAGYPCYAVGGCVRDHLLGLQPHDFDLCTAATPSQIKALFAHYPQVLAGEKHGTVGIVSDNGVVEITTFRTEGDYLDNRHPQQVCFVTSIEEDLSRRDFTVNAMAYSPLRGLCDPFGGAEDLKNGILRAVGQPKKRFQEDSLRILRGMRFAVRFRLQVEEETGKAMFDLAPLMENLARERVFEELCKFLPLAKAEDLLTFAPIITQVIPELAPLVGFDQHSHHHRYDIYTHTAHVVEHVEGDLALRWAALLHDAGKPGTFTLDSQGQGHFYGHAKESAVLADQILLRLKAPTALRQQVVILVEQHMTYPEPEKRQLRRRMSRLGGEMLRKLLILQEADTGSKGTGMEGNSDYFREIRAVLQQIQAEESCLSVRDLVVNGHDLMAMGISGPAIGQCLNRLLEQVMDESLPNEKAALLQAAQPLPPGGSCPSAYTGAEEECGQ